MCEITELKIPGELSDPAGLISPQLEGISGRLGTNRPYTKRAYQRLNDRKKKVEKRKKQAESKPIGSVKLSHSLKKAYLPRTIALKLTDLSEAYSVHLQHLLDSALALGKSGKGVYGTEKEGVLETSRSIAARFENSVVSIETSFATLKAKSKEIIAEYQSSITRVATKLDDGQLKKIKKYCTVDSGAVDGKVVWQPTNILLPLIKGENVYGNKSEALKKILDPKTLVDKSVVRPQCESGDGWKIKMLHMVGKERGPFVFSDHSGFVCKYWGKEKGDLYVYYHSLEHGEQHTITGTARYFGSIPEMKISTFTKNKNNDIKNSYCSIHNPRIHYVECLKDEIKYLVNGVKNSEDEILVVIGECTKSIYMAVKEHLSDVYSKRYNIIGINACKPGAKNEDIDGGPGVNALYGFQLSHQTGTEKVWGINAYMIKKNGSWEQNFLGVRQIDAGHKHALAHLLNNKEDDIALGLFDDGYVSVGGDLNNISAKSELIATCNRVGSRIYVGSNSSATKWYDKIVILSKTWAKTRKNKIIAKNKSILKKRKLPPGGVGKTINKKIKR